jgi:hypothetical protein
MSTIERAMISDTRPPTTPERPYHTCSTCHQSRRDTAPVLTQRSGTEVRLHLCRACLKHHVIRKEDRHVLRAAADGQIAMDRATRPAATTPIANRSTQAARAELKALRRRPATSRTAVRR